MTTIKRESHHRHLRQRPPRLQPWLSRTCIYNTLTPINWTKGMCSFLRRVRCVGSCLRSITVAGSVPFVGEEVTCANVFMGGEEATEKVHIHLGIVLRRRSEKCVVLNVIEQS